MHRLRCLVVIGALAAVATVVAAEPAVAAKGGNSDNAHACQQGGHENRFEAETGRPFRNAGDCSSHTAQGGDTSSLTIDNTQTYPCSALRPGTEPSPPTCWGLLSGSGLELPSAPWAVVIIGGNPIFGTAAGGSIDSVKLDLPCVPGFSVFAGSRTSAGANITSATVMATCG